MFACPDPGGGAERLIVMAETRATADGRRAALRSEIVSTTVDLLGVAPDDVVLAPPRTVPKTSSGKIRRAASREIYQEGRIGARPRALWWELARLRLRGAVPSLRRARRAVGAVAFAVYAWVVYAVLAVAVIVLLALLPRAQWRWRLARWGGPAPGPPHRDGVTVHGLDRLPDGPSIVVANHPSWLDALALATVLPYSFCFVAGEVFKREVLIGFVLKRLGIEFVERYEREHGVADTDRLVALVQAGQSLVIFPEAAWPAPPGCDPSTWARSSSPPRPGCRPFPSPSAGHGRCCGPNTTSRDAEPSISPSVEPIQPLGTDWTAAVGCSAPRGPPSCASRGNRMSNDKAGQSIPAALHFRFASSKSVS